MIMAEMAAAETMKEMEEMVAANNKNTDFS
jgi:hypothetical protein